MNAGLTDMLSLPTLPSPQEGGSVVPKLVVGAGSAPFTSVFDALLTRSHPADGAALPAAALGRGAESAWSADAGWSPVPGRPSSAADGDPIAPALLSEDTAQLLPFASERDDADDLGALLERADFNPAAREALLTAALITNHSASSTIDVPFPAESKLPAVKPTGMDTMNGSGVETGATGRGVMVPPSGYVVRAPVEVPVDAIPDHAAAQGRGSVEHPVGQSENEPEVASNTMRHTTATASRDGVSTSKSSGPGLVRLDQQQVPESLLPANNGGGIRVLKPAGDLPLPPPAAASVTGKPPEFTIQETVRAVDLTSGAAASPTVTVVESSRSGQAAVEEGNARPVRSSRRRRSSSASAKRGSVAASVPTSRAPLASRAAIQGSVTSRQGASVLRPVSGWTVETGSAGVSGTVGAQAGHAPLDMSLAVSESLAAAPHSIESAAFLRTALPTADGRDVERVERFIIESPKLLPRSGRIVVQLEPPQLGRMRIELSSRKGKVTGRMRFDLEAARVLVQRDLPELHRALADAGIRVERLETAGPTAPRDGAAFLNTPGEEQQSLSERSAQHQWQETTRGDDQPHPSSHNHRDAVAPQRQRSVAGSYRAALRVGHVDFVV